MSISAEVSLPARFTSVQETDYFQTFRRENHYRDLILSALLRVHTPRKGPMRLEVVAGPSIVQESSIQRTAEAIGTWPTFTGQFSPYGAESEITHRRFGVTMGAGLSAAVSSRVSIVPSMRVHWIPRAADSYDSRTDSFDQTWYLGLSPWVFRPAVSVRATF